MQPSVASPAPPTGRRIQPGRLWALLLVACLFSGLLPSPLVADRPEKARELLERYNERWAGARAVFRYSVKIGRKGKGEWICHEGAQGKADSFCFRILVESRDRLAPLLQGKVLPGGTRMVIDGWRFREPEEANGLMLDVRFPGADAEGSIRFRKNQSTFTPYSFGAPKRLVAIERFMRIEGLLIQFPEERLVEVEDQGRPAPPRPEPAAKKAPPAVETAEKEVDGIFRPRIEILAVSVQPARVRPGEQVELVVTYEVGGIPKGAAFEVEETRRLLREEGVMASFPATLARGVGTFTSELPVRVPPDTAPGIYTLETEVSLSGVRDAGRALFEVE